MTKPRRRARCDEPRLRHRRRAPALLGPDAQLPSVAVRRAADRVSLRRLPRDPPAATCPTDYRADAAPFEVVAHGVRRDRMGSRAIRSARCATSRRCAASIGLPTVAVAQAWLDRADDAAQCSSGRRRSRSCAACATSRAPTASPSDAAPGGMTDATWRAGYRAAAPQRPALRPADAVVASARGGAARARLPRHADHPQPHRAAGRSQRRGPRRLEARDGATRAPARTWR